MISARRARAIAYRFAADRVYADVATNGLEKDPSFIDLSKEDKVVLHFVLRTEILELLIGKQKENE